MAIMNRRPVKQYRTNDSILPNDSDIGQNDQMHSRVSRRRKCHTEYEFKLPKQVKNTTQGYPLGAMPGSGKHSRLADDIKKRSSSRGYAPRTDEADEVGTGSDSGLRGVSA